MAEENLWLKMYKKCPHCTHGVLADRVRRAPMMKLVFWINVKRYRCNNCDRKTYVFSKLKDKY